MELNQESVCNYIAYLEAWLWKVYVETDNTSLLLIAEVKFSNYHYEDCFLFVYVCVCEITSISLRRCIT